MLLSIPDLLFAYEPNTTHKALTQEIIKFFNYYNPNLNIDGQEQELVMRGSIDEDAGTRPLHHFFDPVYSRGLTMVGVEFLAAKPWSQDTLAQAGVVDSALAGVTKPFFSSRDDYSWGRAIYEYAWGDKQRGLETLGHILHLIEDMSVPDHSRNDTHAPLEIAGDDGSPFEDYLQKWNRGTIKSLNIASNLKASGVTAPAMSSVDAYLISLAEYSNKYFFFCCIASINSTPLT